MKADTRLPVDHFNAELRKIGRSLDDAVIVAHGWKDGQYGIQLAWDGFSAFVSFGDAATTLIEQWNAGRLH